MTSLPSILPTAAPVVGSLLPDGADAGGRARPSAPSGDVNGELDAEVTRLLRVRSGELAEPLLWRRPSVRREVDAVVRQLSPLRTRESLLSSWQRESRPARGGEDGGGGRRGEQDQEDLVADPHTAPRKR